MDYSKFAESSIGQFFLDIKNRLSQVKINASSKDGQDAQKQIHAINTIMTILSEKILPAFDKGAKPNLLAKKRLLSHKDNLIKALNDIGFLKQDVPGTLFDKHPPLKITHATTYQFIKEIFEKINDLPPTLEELFPFFNPDAVNTDLSGTFVSRATKNININELTHTGQFQFKLTYKDKTKDKIIDANKKYKELLPEISNSLAKIMGQYYQDYSEQQDVIDELKHNEWIDSLIKKASKVHDNVTMPSSSMEQNLPEIERALGNIKEAINLIEEKTTWLSNLKNRFKQKNLQELLKEHQINVTPPLDSTRLLPAAIIIKSENDYKPLNVYQKLEQAYSLSLSELQNKKELLILNQDAIIETRNDEIKRLREQYCEQNTRPIKTLSNNLHNIIANELAIESTPQAIEKQLEDLKQQQREVAEIKNSLNELQNNEISCPDELIKADKTALTFIKKNHQNALNSCSEELEKALKQLNTREVELNNQAFAAAQQQELLKNMTVDSIVKLLDEKQSELPEKKDNLTQAKHQLTSITDQIDKNEQNIKQYSEEKSTQKQECIKQLDDIKNAVSYKRALKSLIDFTGKKETVESHFTEEKLLTLKGVGEAIDYIEKQEFNYNSVKDSFTKPQKPKKENFSQEDYNLKIQLYKTNLKSLKVLEQTNQSFFNAKSGITYVLTSLNNFKPLVDGYEEIVNHFGAFLEQKEQLQKEQEHLNNHINHLTVETGLLEKEIGFLENVKTFLHRSSDLNFHSIQEITDSISILDELYQLYQQLDGENELKSKDEYQQILKKLNELLNSYTKTIQSTLETIIDAEQSKPQSLPAITSSISKLNELDQLYQTLDGKNELNSKEKYEPILETLNELRENLTDTIQSNLTDILNNEQSRLDALGKNLDSVRFDEASETYHNISSALVDKQQSLAGYPETGIDAISQAISQKEPFNKVNNQIQLLKNKRDEVTQKIQKKSAINDGIASRIDERTLLAENFRGKLDTYINKREKQYTHKDKFFSGDKQKRNDFINNLKTTLNDYAKNGDDQKILGLIENKKNEFAGFKLQSLLNRLAVAVIDSAKKVPENYDEEQIPAAASKTYLQVLNQFKQNGGGKAQYADAMADIYNHINALKVYGATLNEADKIIVHDHAQALEARVTAFVLAHPDELPNQEQTEAFQKEFGLHLHSKDDAMCHHESWKPFIANIAIAVLTLGIATGIQLISSKMSTGRFAFFCDRSERLARLDKMDELNEELSTKISAV